MASGVSIMAHHARPGAPASAASAAARASCAGCSTLGSSIACGPSGASARTSSSPQGVSRPLTRTMTLRRPKPPSRKACVTCTRASSLADTATASSRSRISASASSSRARASARALAPGV
ncbi:Uncharacterised protein [Bordetella pertussis]|nr:Uncharacterised protein [Bordetella pertussis]